ncbi:MAG: alpha-amylase [Butyrivibrio sp.]|nr:alpha-amylase [Butyrivibrio sp.]
MKKVSRELVGVLATALMTAMVAGCAFLAGATYGGEPGANDRETPLNIIDDEYRTTYEVFVYSFYDSDGDGIGDLQGLIQKLDYINDGNDKTDTDLGCNQIWLMPVSPSPTYHKYDVTDYMDIDPQYGSLDDYDRLIQACHDRGIRVIIDLVLNHTSSEHPWFKEASDYVRNHEGEGLVTDKALLECPYLDYYNFSPEKKEGYEPLPNSSYYYEARFWSGMPDLNLDSERVRKEISDITQFWIEHGTDGFRLDATTSYYTGDDSKNIEFMTWLNNTVKGQKEDAYLVGEAWSNMASYSKYYKSGIDSFFNFEFAGSEGIIAGVAKGSSGADRYPKALKNCEDLLYNTNPDYVDAPFYTNHDMARAAGYYVGKGASDKLKLSAALNLLMGGNAFIYYGEELGMKGSGKDENKRAPMYWSLSDTTGMCKGPADMDKFEMKYPPLDEQMQDPYSVYNYYKSCIRLRNTYPVIARGRTYPVEELSDKDVAVFIRKTENTEDESFGPKELMVVINTSGDAKELTLPDDETVKYAITTGEQEPSLSDGVLSLPAYCVTVLGR